MKRNIKTNCCCLFFCLFFSAPMLWTQPENCVIPLGTTISNSGKIESVITGQNVTVNVYLKDELKVYSPTAELEEIERRLQELAVKEQLLEAKASDLENREEGLHFKEESMAETSAELNEKMAQFLQDIKGHEDKIAYYEQLFSKNPASPEAAQLFQDAKAVIGGASCLSEDYRLDVKEFKNAAGKKVLVFPIEKLKNDPNFVLLGETSEGLTSIKRFNKFGFVDQQGNEVIPCRFDETYAFHNGHCLAKIGNQFLVIDHKGKILHKVEENPFSASHLSGEYYCFNEVHSFKSVYHLSKNEVIVSAILNFQFVKEKNWVFYLGVINGGSQIEILDLTTGQKVNLINTPIDYLSPFNQQGNAFCRLQKQEKKKDQYKIFNWDKGILPGTSFDNIRPPSPIRGFFIGNIGDNRFVLDENGKQLFNNHEIKLPVKKNSKTSSIEKAPYTEIILFQEDLNLPYISFVAYHHKNAGYDRPKEIDDDLPPIPEQKISDSDNLSQRYDNYSYVLLDAQTRQLVTDIKILAYQAIDENNLMPVQLYDSEDWSLLDYATGQLITEEKFTKILISSEGIYPIARNDRWAFLSKDGFRITEYKYTDATTQFSDGTSIVVVKSNKHGVINKQGAEIIPPIFDKIITLTDGTFKVTIDDQSFSISSKGRCLDNCDNYKKILSNYYQKQ